MNPESTETEPTLEESLRSVMQTLPAPVRQYLAAGKHATVAGELMKKYGLHIDQAGEIETQLMLLLMGIATPAEFSTALVSGAAIPKASVSGILEDVNQMVFIPLREEVRRSGIASGNGTPVAGVIHATVSPQPVSAQQTIVPTIAAPLPPSPPATPPLTQSPATQTGLPQAQPTTLPLSGVIEVPLPAHDNAPLPPRNVLPNAAVQAPRGAIVHPPLPTRQAPPPPNLPGVPPAFVDLHPHVPEELESASPNLPPIPPRPAPPQPAPLAPAPPYSVDPYREPPE